MPARLMPRLDDDDGEPTPKPEPRTYSERPSERLAREAAAKPAAPPPSRVILTERVFNDEGMQDFLSRLSEDQMLLAKVLPAPWGFIVFYPKADG